jgi:hypothetical protein
MEEIKKGGKGDNFIDKKHYNYCSCKMILNVTIHSTPL